MWRYKEKQTMNFTSLLPSRILLKEKSLAEVVVDITSCDSDIDEDEEIWPLSAGGTDYLEITPMVVPDTAMVTAEDGEPEEEEEETDSSDPEQLPEDVEKTTQDALDEQGDNDDDDKDSYEDSEEEFSEDDEEETLQEAIFALQDKFFFLKKIHSHRNVKVLKAVDRATGSVCCIKIVVRRGIGKLLSRIPIEVKMLVYLKQSLEVKHPWVWATLQHILAYYENSDVYVIVSEYVKEASFRRYLAPDPDNVRNIMCKLLTALSAMHDLKIIYRDFKSSNLLFDDVSNNVTIVDFDLSTFQTPANHSVVLGTSGFFAPEVAAFDPDSIYFNKKAVPYNHKIDIWSMGVVFGCLIYKISESDVDEKTVRKWKKALQKKKKNIAEDLMLKMLTFSPSQRPEAREILEHPYFKITPPLQ